jgi:hippurate hydrolase
VFILDSIAASRAEMIQWRRTLHSNPELRFKECKTADLVAQKLAEFGIEVSRGLATTGVVGTLKGKKPGNRAIALRADMDALPITEMNSFAHCSTNRGCMHACGHDGHTAMLLGAARYLAESRNFAGTVHFIFQPGEEGGAGAKVMMDEGLFESHPADEVFAIHNLPGLPFGTFAGRAGKMMPSADKIEIHIRGRGGHAAEPHKTVDPILIGAHIVSALQSIVSRSADPLESLVVSITEFHAGSAFNVIDETAVLRGTVRSLSHELRQLAQERIGAIASGIASALGGQAELNYMRTYPPLINHRAQLEAALAVAAEVVGKDKVEGDMTPSMGAEDFAYMLQTKPGAYLFLGAGTEGEQSNLHQPRYDFNDDLLPLGATFWSLLVERTLPAT